MPAPRNHTNQPTRRIVALLPPYLEEWAREQARTLYPDAPLSGPQSQMSRFLRGLLEAERSEG